jgi:hypothetical protein
MEVHVGLDSRNCIPGSCFYLLCLLRNLTARTKVMMTRRNAAIPTPMMTSVTGNWVVDGGGALDGGEGQTFGSPENKWEESFHGTTMQLVRLSMLTFTVTCTCTKHVNSLFYGKCTLDRVPRVRWLSDGRTVKVMNLSFKYQGRHLIFGDLTRGL